MTASSPFDVTVPVDVLRALVTAATLDAKTGLLTCPAWQPRAAARLARADRPFALYLVDLDRFRAVNAAVGHLAADAVLARAARALCAATGPDGVVGRFGGDEFVVAVPVDDRWSARRIGQRMCDGVATPVPGGGLATPGGGLSVTASVGGAVTRSTGSGLTESLWAADSALYTAKRSGGNTARIFGSHQEGVAASGPDAGPSPADRNRRPSVGEETGMWR